MEQSLLSFYSTSRSDYSPYSYRVSKDSSGIVHAISTVEGLQSFSGENASEVINAAIGSIPITQGGEIRIMVGEYELDHPILIDRHGIHLSGEGRKSGCYGGPPYMKSNNAINLIEIRMANERIRGLTISNISFYGSGTDNGHSGIYADGCSDALTIQNVGVYQCETGIYLKGGPSGAVDAAQIYFCDPQQCGRGLVLEYCHYTKVVGGEYSDNSNSSLPPYEENGIYLTSNEHGYTLGVKLIGITAVRNGGAGVHVGKGSVDIAITSGCDFGGNRSDGGLKISDEHSGQRPNNIIVNAIFSYNNHNSGIVIDQADHVFITGCSLSVHEHGHVSNESQSYGVYIMSGSDTVAVSDNMFHGNEDKAIWDESSTNQVLNNILFP